MSRLDLYNGEERSRKKKSLENKMFSRLLGGGGWGISFLNFAKHPIECSGYVLQNSSVTVQKQRTVLFFYCVRIPLYIPSQNKKALTCVNAFLLWRRMGDSNPRAREGKRFSRPPRYDHFDNPPCPMTLIYYHILRALSRDFLILGKIILEKRSIKCYNNISNPENY